MGNSKVIENNSFEWQHGGDLIAKQLKEEGVDYIFTLTGGHISGIYDGARFQDIRLIDFRHEQAAVHAADAFARIKRDAAVAALTAGPGVTNGLTAIANAYYSNSPVITLGGRNPFALGSNGNLQDAPHLELTKPITKYSEAIYDVWRSNHIIREAFSVALMPRYGPAYVDVPIDVQLTQLVSDQTPPVRKKCESFFPIPDAGSVRKVKEMLSKSKAPIVIAGSGAYWAKSEKLLSEFTKIFQLPVFLNGMARGLLGRNHSNQVVSSRSKLLGQADLLLLLGVDLDFRFGYGQADSINPETQIIQVDPDASVLGKHRDVDLGIVSDIGGFLAELISIGPASIPRDRQKFLSDIRARDLKKIASWKDVSATSEAPIHPKRFVYEIASFLDEDTIVIGDGGDIVALFADFFRAGRPGYWMDPGPFGCIGIGVPFAMGARLARPDKPIVVISGDGAFGFNGFEIEAASRQNLPFVLIIGNDGAWGEMRTFHEDIFGPEDPSAQYLSQSTKYETIVNGLGGFGQRVERASEIVPALKRAFKANVPSVINVILDPKFRREAQTISGKQVAIAYGNGDQNAYKRNQLVL